MSLEASATDSPTAQATLTARVLDALPQTQCTRCGYPDCAAYAQAVVSDAAAINQCPPGGNEGVIRLSQITGHPALPLNPEFGMEGPRKMVFIDENWCIGCTLCLDACPTDAIMGSNKRMHTVIEAYCTGCERCLPVCPVDCILVEPASGNATGWNAWSAAQADQARARYAFASTRRIQNKGQQPIDDAVVDQKRAVIEAAVARARAKRDASAG